MLLFNSLESEEFYANQEKKEREKPVRLAQKEIKVKD